MPTQDALPKMADLTGSQARFDRWINNFGSEIVVLGAASPPGVAIGGAGAAGPPDTGLVLLAALVTKWNAAYALADNTATRTHANIVALQTLRFNPERNVNPFGASGPGVPGEDKGLVGALRHMIRAIQGAGTSNAAILANLGLTTHTNIRGVPLIPNAGPELTLDRSAPHVMAVRYKQEGVHESIKAKPPGCKGVLVQWQCGNSASGSKLLTKCPGYIDVGAAQSGQSIRMQGFWVMGNSKVSGGGNIIMGGVP
jgi:hypothetical protein